MKKNKTFFASFALLLGIVVTGCGQTPSSSSTGGTENPTTGGITTPTTSAEQLPISASDALNRLKSLTKMGFSGTLNSKFSRVDDETKKGEENLSSKMYFSSDELYILGTYENGVNAVKYHYFKNAEGQLITKSVNAKNEVTEEVMSLEDDAQKTPLMFDEAVKNPFILLKEEDFVSSTANSVTFSLKREVGSTTVGSFVYSVITGYSVPAENMIISFNEDESINKIQITGTQFSKTTGRYDYNYIYNYEAIFTSKESLNVPSYPYESTDDMSKLSRALELIKNHNYEMKLYSSFVNDGLTPNLSAIVTPNGFIVKDETTEGALPYGMINVKSADSTSISRAIIEVRTDESTGKVQAVGTEKEIANSSVDEYYPKADYNVNLFAKTEKGYVLQDAYQEVSTLIPDANTVDITYMFGVNVLTFDIADDLSKITYSYIFKGINGYGTRTVEMTNLGTAQLPFDIETGYVKYDKATTWAELDPTTKKEADQYLGADLDQILPFVTTDGTITMYAYSDYVEIRVSCATDKAATDLMSDYGFSLIFGGGFTQDENDENSYVKDGKYRVDLEIDMFASNELVITLSLENNH